MEQKRRLLKKYLEGKANQEEKKLVDQWYDNAGDSPGPDWLTRDITEKKRNEAWAELSCQFNFKQPDGIIHKSPRIKLRNYARHVTRYAAILVIVILTGFLFHRLTEAPEGMTNTEVVKNWYTTGKRQHKILTLGDGSVVRLNSESRLAIINNQYNVAKREVWLEDGEAFFEVTKNPGKPFVVHSPRLTTTVVGTSFNIRSDSIQQLAEVTVVTGKVNVAVPSLPHGETTDLIPGEQVRLSMDKQHLKKQKVEIGLYTGWKDGILIFKNMPFREVKQRLERWFGVTIKIRNQTVYRSRVTASFDHKSLHYVLSSLGTTSHFDFVIEKDTVLIK